MKVLLLPLLAHLLAVVSALPPLTRNVGIASTTLSQEHVVHWHLLRQDGYDPADCRPQLPPGVSRPPWPPPANRPDWLPDYCPWPPPTPAWVTQTASATTTSTTPNSIITSAPNASTAVASSDTVSNRGIPLWGIIVIALASVALVLAAIGAMWWCRWRQLYTRARRIERERQQQTPLVQDTSSGSMPSSASPRPSTTAAGAVKARYITSHEIEGSDPDRNSLPPGHPYGDRVPSPISFVSGGTLVTMGAALTTPRGAWITRSTLPVTEEHQLRHRPASIASSGLTASTNILFAPMALSDNGHSAAPAPPAPPAPATPAAPPANMGISP